ncbi:hypothetical protein NC652_038452 [Populus alba x Populus x berolinensis]|uniref:Uncharacterized protein n=1 Tax=Populus tomentosa TaxID=118781 RepID=A0A8X8BZT4_POPTO|nr:hypothetical protein POTOM_054052 [Populus tomentosa]KAJ6867224.1 hypothetical protein NC652_038452 [Populus alba x Populus x berolinensis]
MGFSITFVSTINTNSLASVDSKMGAFQGSGFSPMDSHKQPAGCNANNEMGCQFLNSNIPQRSRYRKQRLLSSIASLQDTTEEVENSSMDSATRIGNSRRQHEQPVTIVGAPTTDAEVCNTIAAGSILDIKNQMAREASDWHAIQQAFFTR